MRRRGVFASALAVVVSVVVLLGGQAFAASGTGDALSISPVVDNIVVKAGTSDTVPVYIQNLTKVTMTLQGVVNDFTANPNESGDPDIILNPNQSAPSHGLKQFVTPLGKYTLQPGERDTVNVTIAVPKGAAGGGYYGVVRFEPATSSSSNNTNVSLSASVGTLILATVPGNLVQRVTIAGFNATNSAGNSNTVFTSNKGIQAAVRFQNEGNVQEQPFGTILVKKGNKTVDTVPINNTTPRGNVLPNSIRKFTVSLSGIGSFGKYTLEGNFGYGTNGQLLTAQTTIYIIPIWMIIGVIVVILIVLFLMFGLPRLIKRYNRSVIRKANKQRR